MSSRPYIEQPDTIQPPFPIRVITTVVAGFGRGSKELGIPTANVAREDIDKVEIEAGVYYGFVQVFPRADKATEVHTGYGADQLREVEYNYGHELRPGIDYGKGIVHPMVMSLGWNPFYGNSQKTGELYILHDFEHDFYGATMKFMILGYVRPELNFVSKEALIKDIHIDADIARETLKKENYLAMKQDPFFNVEEKV